MGKAWYQSKTIWVAILEIAAAVLALVATFLEVGNFTAPAIVLLVAAVLQIILRFVTDLPIV